MPKLTPTRHRLIWALALAWAVLSTGWWVLRGLPQPIAASAPPRVDCLSYAPFRLPGESPFNVGTSVSRERIEEDLRLLSQRTRCVRTYSVDQGLDAVPEVARSMGMRVLLGAWIGRDRQGNARELAQAIDIARRHHDVIDAVIVGNEVLLRRELPPEELRSAIARVRAAVPVPVTYADVWEFWLAHPDLAATVDFVTVHILPYWEDEPIGVEHAVRHVIDTYHRVHARLDAARVLIGETGWPSDGRAREEAVPGRIEQARFVREFLVAAAAEGIEYNLIEGFDQPWKRRLEGAMGGHWGILDSAGNPKFPMRGPVVPDPSWEMGPAAALGGALGFALLAAGAARRGRALLLHALVGTAAGAVGAAQWRYMVTWNRDWLEWTATLPLACAAIALAWLTADALAAWMGGRRSLAAPGIHRALPALARRPAQQAGTPVLGVLRFLFLFGAATMALLLVFDARYRGFPSPLYLTPAFAFVLLAIAGLRLPAHGREERLLGLVALAGTAMALWNEGVHNPQAIGYFGVILVLVLVTLLPPRPRAAGPAEGERDSARPASSTATAEGSYE